MNNHVWFRKFVQIQKLYNGSFYVVVNFHLLFIVYKNNFRATVAPADFSNDILGRTKRTLLTPNCLAGFNPSITKDWPGCQLFRDRGINKKLTQEHQKR